MRILKSHPLLKLINSYLIDSSQPSNISYAWNFGSLLAICLIFQILTGVTLAMHYNPSIMEAFNSIEHIMKDVNNGWLIRYLHSNTASYFFLLVYLHIGRGIYYGSFKASRTLVWIIGAVIVIAMIATGFLGYVLPYGQMSLWGATVITNLISAIPWIGQDIVEFIWGGFSVNNATLSRFFALHYLLPFLLAAFILLHLIALHDTTGSSNPIGISGSTDRISFSPYYLFKDLITIFILISALVLFVIYGPNNLGDSENYISANPMQTPAAIVPEWYLLPFYAILRSIPDKFLGVIAMFSAILAILLLPLMELSRFKGIQFRPISKIAFWLFVADFLMLMKLGACHVESPYIELGQICTGLYFSYFLLIVPLISLLENILVNFNLSSFAFHAKRVEANKQKVNLNNLSYFFLFSLFLCLYVVISSFFGESIFAESSDEDDEGNQENEAPRNQENEAPRNQENEAPRNQENEAPHDPASPGSNNSGDTGYETDSNRSHFEEGIDAMVLEPVQNIPDDFIVRYIEDLGEMIEDPEYWDNQSERNDLINRQQDLQEELDRRNSRSSNNNNNS